MVDANNRGGLSAPAPAPEIQTLIDEHSIEFVRFEQSDAHGLARLKIIPIRHFTKFASQGLNFPLPPLALDVHCAPGRDTGYLEERGYGDSLLFPDLSTFRILPWGDRTARVIADPHHLSGEPVPVGSRNIVKPLLDELRTMGFQLLSGFEYEFYLLDAKTKLPSFPEVRQFGVLHPADEAIVHDIVRSMAQLGVDVITANLEYGAGQVEINFAPDWGLVAADAAFTFKNGVKEIAIRHERLATFMTKPDIGASANGCHYNQSLWRDGVNAFADPERSHGLSDIALHFIAGQLLHAPALMAFCAPTVNCGKRIRPDFFAPTHAAWGIDNRTVAFRVRNLDAERTYVENRLGGGAANPYLVQAASLAAGMDGIRRRLLPTGPVKAGAAEAATAAALPNRLEDALDALERDDIIREALGHEFSRLFVGLKRQEIAKAQASIPDYGDASFSDRVDQWERHEFLELL